jgi:ABC-type oligopeptide transport system substrate-binding subunit
MPLIETLLYTALSGSANLTSLVGTRISPAKTLQASDFPCVTFHLLDDDQTYTHDGPAQVVADQWQFNAWSLDYDEMRAVKVAIREALYAGSGFDVFLKQNPELYEEKTRVHHGPYTAHVWHAS